MIESMFVCLRCLSGQVKLDCGSKKTAAAAVGAL